MCWKSVCAWFWPILSAVYAGAAMIHWTEFLRYFGVIFLILFLIMLVPAFLTTLLSGRFPWWPHRLPWPLERLIPGGIMLASAVTFIGYREQLDQGPGMFPRVVFGTLLTILLAVVVFWIKNRFPILSSSRGRKHSGAARWRYRRCINIRTF
jgi:hypothetical protein